MNPVHETAAAIKAGVVWCRERNFPGALFRFHVAEACSNDAVQRQADIEHAAYAAEQEDCEAAKLLKSALADGINPNDTGAIRRALRLVSASQKHDHRAGELSKA